MKRDLDFEQRAIFTLRLVLIIVSLYVYIYIYFVASKYLKSERDMNEDIKRKEETVIGDWRNQCGPSRSTIVVFSRGRRRS